MDSLDTGGAERHCTGLAVALRSRNHDVSIACSVDGPLSRDLDGLRILPLLPSPVKRRVSLDYARRIEDLLSRERFDLIHAHLFASVAATARAMRVSNVPLVVTEHTQALWQDAEDREVHRRSLARADRVIAVSRDIETRLQREPHGPGKRVEFIPNALPPRLSSSSAGERSLRHSRDRLLIKSARKEGARVPALVGVIARLVPEKGVSIFLEAAAVIALQVPTVRFIVVGHGPLRSSLERQAHRLGLESLVSFLGSRSDAYEILTALNVLVVPSLSEGSPLVVLEAMDAGVPLVASRVGGIPDQARHRREALLVRPGDPSELAQAVLILLRDPAYGRRISRAGLLRSVEMSHAKMIDAVEDSYRMAEESRLAGIVRE